MEITFRSKKLQKLCCSAQEMQRALGSARAKKLQQRLLELAAAECLLHISHLPPPRRHEMTGGRSGQISVDLDHPYRLYFVPANDPVPRREDGGLDLSAVTQIEIIELADPH